jgi:hypothetical protein
MWISNSDERLQLVEEFSTSMEDRRSIIVAYLKKINIEYLPDHLSVRLKKSDNFLKASLAEGLSDIAILNRKFVRLSLMNLQFEGFSSSI